MELTHLARAATHLPNALPTAADHIYTELALKGFYTENLQIRILETLTEQVEYARKYHYCRRIIATATIWIKNAYQKETTAFLDIWYARGLFYLRITYDVADLNADRAVHCSGLPPGSAVPGPSLGQHMRKQWHDNGGLVVGLILSAMFCFFGVMALILSGMIPFLYPGLK